MRHKIQGKKLSLQRKHISIIEDRKPAGRGINKGIGSKSFDEYLNNITLGADPIVLKYVLEEYEEKSKKIIQDPSLKNLKEFRIFIQKVLSEILNSGLELKKITHKSYHPGKISRSLKEYQVIKINKELESLSNKILDSKNKALNFLIHFEEIRGLLLNLLS